MAAELAPALQRFVDRTTMALAEQTREDDFLPRIGEAMVDLVADASWLDPAFAKPHPEFYQQYLLYAAPNDAFSVVSFVWGPGQKTPIHDHTVWGVIGVLQGAELAENFHNTTTGMESEGGQILQTGQVAFVSPRIGDIHRVENAHDDRVSISIHAYGANIGKISRHVFAEDGVPKSFISGYANAETE